MGNIRSKDTAEERAVATMLRTLGYRFRTNDKNLPGKPDFSFPKLQKVIFVNGCFWHGHRTCRRMIKPKSNKAFWTRKIALNRKRDRQTYRALRKLGSRYLVVWQCQIHGMRSISTVERLRKFLVS